MATAKPKAKARVKAKTTEEAPAVVHNHLYELLFLCRPTAEADAGDNVLNTIEKTLTDFGAKTLRKDKFGRKRLAYEIQRYKDALLSVYVVEMPTTAVAKLRTVTKLNEDILRLMVKQLDSFDPNAEPQRFREREDSRENRGGGGRDNRGPRDGGGRPPRRQVS